MIEAELAVIGTLLNYFPRISEACQIVTPEMFENVFCRESYRVILRAYDNNEVVGYPVIAEHLKEFYDPEDIKTQQLDCLDYADALEFIENLKVIKKCWQVRKIKDSLLQHQNISFNTVTEDLSDLINELESIAGTNDRNNVRSLSDIAKEYKDEYFKKKDIPMLRFPFSTLDELIKGLEGGDLICIGARPGVGKSAFVAQLALNFIKDGKRVGFYSLEMKPKQLYERFAAIASGLTMDKIRTAEQFDSEQEKTLFDDGNNFLEKKTTLFISEGARTVSQIRRESQHMEYDLIIIDYLQLIKPESNYRGNRYAEVGEISHSLKAMAMDFNIPVIALSQLNRVSAGSGKETKPPTMSEMRESGDIEQDASIIILLWDKNEERTLKGVKVPKNRQGKFGECELMYNGALMSFSDPNGYTPTGNDDFVAISNNEKLPWD